MSSVFDITTSVPRWWDRDLADGALFDGDLAGAGAAGSTTEVLPMQPAYASMLRALFPPGNVWRFIDSTLGAVIDACVDELGRLDLRAADLLDEADPRTASELLPEYERELDLASVGTFEERRAQVVARTVARQRFRPIDFQLALAALLGQDAESVVVIETTPAAAAAIGDAREVFRFFIFRDPTLPGIYYVSSAQALVDQIKPSHTLGFVIERTNALYDDPLSLYDRDVLGA